MDSNVLAKQIAGEILNSFYASLKSLNPFTFLQVIFIIELYYLMINSIMNSTMTFFQSDGIDIAIPVGINNYNEMILDLLNMYAPFIFLLSICMFISGASLFVLKYLPWISNYKLIRKYCDYGFYAATWLFMIYFAYETFLFLGSYFILFFTGIFGVGALLKNLLSRLMNKLGLTFG